ncbi:MAG: sulfatase [Kiritimatiellae bacterium]|nr:sulfatase [Kiritimatiellia bacterium]
MAEGRPNILFIFADDWGRYAGAYRQVEGDRTPNALLNTPNFDRVAREGVLFTNAFVPAPSCTPCRSSLLSGRYFWQTGLGAILQGAVWDASIPSYPLLLEQAGYHIGYTYKVWSPGTPRDAPYGADRTRYAPAGTRFGRFSFVATEHVAERGVEGAKAVLYDEVRRNFDAFLAARPPGAPFCYWWGPTNTHREWQRGSGKALWGLEPDDLKGRLPAFLPDVHEVREDVCDYLGECLAVDAGLGLLLARVEQLGELDNTFVVVSGDHGIPGFPRGKCNLYDFGCEVALAARWPGRIPAGRIVDDFVNIMDLAPTFLEAAGLDPPEGMAARGLMDVLRSEKAGQVDPERTFVVTGRERHVAKARAGNLPYPQRAIRTKGFLYIRNFEPDRWPMGDPKGLDNPATEPPPFEELEHNTFVAYADLDASPSKAWMVHHRGEEQVRRLFEMGFGKFPAEELYDLAKDPYYMNNVAGAPAYQSIQRQLAERLMAVLKEQRDPRVAEPACRFERAPFTNA